MDLMRIMSILSDLNLNQGYITEPDFEKCAKEFGFGVLGDYVIKQTFKELDNDQDGKLELSDALAAIETLKNLFEEYNKSS